MRLDPEARAALLNWVKLFPVNREVERLEDLDDGVVFSQVLQDMDPEYNPTDVNRNASSWLDRKRNLEAVFKGIDRYVCRDREGDLDWLARSYKQKEIAESADDKGLGEVLVVLLYAAMSGPSKGKYLRPIQEKLRTQDQKSLVEIFTQKEEQKAKVIAAAKIDDTIEHDGNLRDRELEFEEERAKHKVQVEALAKQNGDLLTRLERLQLINEDLKESEAKYREEVDETRKLHTGNHDAIIKRLEDRARELEDLIQQQEHQIEEDRLAKMRLGTENAQLSRQAQNMLDLQDEVSELRHLNEELSKKANAAERYKQKLESQQFIEKDLKNLQYELEAARKDLAGYEKLKAQTEVQAGTILQYRKVQEEIELQLSDMREQRNNAAELLATKTQELERLMAQKACDEKMIMELREQMTSGGAVSLSSSPDRNKGGAFDLSGDETTVGLRLELSKLKAENSLLRNNMGVSSANEQLRADLELSKRSEARLMEKLHEMRRQQAISQEQIQAMMCSMTDQGSQAYLELHRSVLQSSAELAREKERARQLEAELKDSNREVLSLKTDYNVATKGSIDALQELKSTDGLISASLRDELENLRKAYDGLQMDNAEQKTQLIEALVSREKLRQALEDAALREDSSAVAAAAAATAAATATAVDPALAGLDAEALDDMTRKNAEKVDRLRTRIRQMTEQLQKADQERYELQRRLKAAEQGGAYAAMKAANEQTIKNLQRENAMISTAWYDLTSRLQSNHVVLQRRQDMPKSWLNKQRQMVNGEFGV